MLNISGCMLGPKAGGYTSAARVAASAASTSRKWTACRLVSVQAGTAGGYIPAATGDAAAADTSAAATDNELTANGVSGHRGTMGTLLGVLVKMGILLFGGLYQTSSVSVQAGAYLPAASAGSSKPLCDILQ